MVMYAQVDVKKILIVHAYQNMTANLNKELTKTKMENFKKYAIITLIHLLVLTSAGLAIYAKSVKYTTTMENQILKGQIQELQSQKLNK